MRENYVPISIMIVLIGFNIQVFHSVIAYVFNKGTVVVKKFMNKEEHHVSLEYELQNLYVYY